MEKVNDINQTIDLLKTKYIDNQVKDNENSISLYELRELIEDFLNPYFTLNEYNDYLTNILNFNVKNSGYFKYNRNHIDRFTFDYIQAVIYNNKSYLKLYLHHFVPLKRTKHYVVTVTKNNNNLETVDYYPTCYEDKRSIDTCIGSSKDFLLDLLGRVDVYANNVQKVMPLMHNTTEYLNVLFSIEPTHIETNIYPGKDVLFDSLLSLEGSMKLNDFIKGNEDEILKGIPVPTHILPEELQHGLDLKRKNNNPKTLTRTKK